tara:strand:+ start:344 stop:703 length:360 start_codon:yes stop_codon:yes gene_type:complete
MAITSDGTQSFGIESSPLSINGVTFVAEGLNFSFTGSRVDINDSNNEPLGATVIPGRTECTGTVQLAANTTGSNVRQQEFTISATNSDIDGVYLVTEASEAQTAGDYVKVAFTAFKKTN